VQRLETRVVTRLFQRTKRAVRLTEEGETCFEAERAALDRLTATEVSLAARREDPEDRIQLGIPVGFGRLLLPSFASLREQHPRVTLEVSLTDRQSDPVGEGWGHRGASANYRLVAK
jgi:DNA-binding transcriptional LysR family regulator